MKYLPQGHRSYGLLGLLAALALCASSPSQTPTTQPVPASQPSVVEPTFDLKGTISIDSGWTLKAPDLTRVVVFLDTDTRLSALAPPSATVTVRQQHKLFVPNFTVVPCGTSVEFPNFDDFDHNVFSLSKAAPAFDLDRYPRGKSKTRVFNKVGVVQVFCNIHPTMRAIIVVTPNAFSARADEEGHFVIHGVPAGSFKLVAWQERCAEERVDVTIGPALQSADLTIALHANRRSIAASEAPPDSGAYGVERGLGVKREHLDIPVVQDAHDVTSPGRGK